MALLWSIIGHMFMKLPLDTMCSRSASHITRGERIEKYMCKNLKDKLGTCMTKRGSLVAGTTIID